MFFWEHFEGHRSHQSALTIQSLCKDLLSQQTPASIPPSLHSLTFVPVCLDQQKPIASSHGVGSARSVHIHMLAYPIPDPLLMCFTACSQWLGAGSRDMCWLQGGLGLCCPWSTQQALWCPVKAANRYHCNLLATCQWEQQKVAYGFPRQGQMMKPHVALCTYSM